MFRSIEGRSRTSKAVCLSFRNKDGFIVEGRYWITRAPWEDPSKVAVRVFDLSGGVLTKPYVLDRGTVYKIDSLEEITVEFRRKHCDPFLKALIRSSGNADVVRESAFIRNVLMDSEDSVKG